MTPAQMRQLAATRFMSANKQEWADKAVQALREAADQIESPLWQPIETAPKNGTRVLVQGNNYNDPERGQHTCVAQWINGGWMEASDWNPTSELEYLTDWAPIPAAGAKP